MTIYDEIDKLVQQINDPIETVYVHRIGNRYLLNRTGRHSATLVYHTPYQAKAYLEWVLLDRQKDVSQ